MGHRGLRVSRKLREANAFIAKRELRSRNRRARSAMEHFIDKIDVLRCCARNHGYALAVHGSLVRDIDLLAVPWVPDAKPPQTLKKAMFKLMLALNGGKGVMASARGIRKPHGRRAYVIHFGETYIDLSVMPRRNAT